MQLSLTKMKAKPDTVIVGQADSIPLCVDLDGTVLRTDCLWESFFCALKDDPHILVKSAWWLCMGGRARLKRQLAMRTDLAVSVLPYNHQVIEFLKRERQQGRQIVMVTATDETVARRIAAHLNLFDEVYGSDGVRNLKGRLKADFLVNRFGVNCFDYVGDSTDDLPLWQQSRKAFLVRPTSRLIAAVSNSEAVVLDGSATVSAKAVLNALRPHQWLKNLLLFVPFLAAHNWMSMPVWLRLIGFFIAFSLTASSVYLLNDLIDLESDRRHLTKHRRPLASGALPLQWGAGGCVVCLAAGFAITATQGWSALGLLVAYLACTTWYSLDLKRRLALDVIVLASLYTFRLIGGAVVADVTLSPWFMALSMFLFLSLATAKRYSELLNQKGVSEAVNSSRSYRPEDLPQLSILGGASGYLAVLVLALYINSEQIALLYKQPIVIWALCPLLLYWISRLWFLTNRGQMHEDPVVFALKDRVSYALVILTALVTFVAGPR
jgi:4-hydroxybenzoate polyprenyltransferase